MNENERKTGVDDQLLSYQARQFVTTDARQMAYDNYESLVFSPSGLAGAIPFQTMESAEVPRGFRYTINDIGLGGTPAPAGNMSPLVSQSDFAETFIRNTTGAGGWLY